METLLAIVVMVLAAGGLAVGSLLGRGPARTSCGAGHRHPDRRCADCPLRRGADASEAGR